jgi:GNAT superfamily N-acetyltransferase
MAYNRIRDLNDYEALVQNYRNKGVLTNNYMLTDEVVCYISMNKLFYHHTEHNAVILLEKETCFRVYYYINDLAEKIFLSSDYSYAIEILYRGDSFYPEKEALYWQDCGFTPHFIRDFYVAKYSDIRLVKRETYDVSIQYASTLDDVLYAIRLFNRLFDSYTGDYLDESLAPSLLQGRNILLAYCGGMRKGACHFYEKNKVIYLGHLAVEADARGKKIGSLLMNTMIDATAVDDKSRYALWVQRQNEGAIKLYQAIGYKYNNKSTISLLNLKKEL